MAALTELVDDAGDPVVWAPEAPPSPEARRLMGTLGVIIREPMTVTSAHELLEVHDCTYRSCANEAAPGSDRCPRHQRETDLVAQHVTECECGQRFVGTELRGRGWLNVHSQHCRKAQRAAPSRPREPVAAPVPRAPLPIPKLEEAPVSVKKLDPAEEAAALEVACAQFRRFRENHGRWPLPIDAREYVAEDLPPGEHFGDQLPGGWTRPGADGLPDARVVPWPRTA